jgi:cytochrome c551/c552
MRFVLFLLLALHVEASDVGSLLFNGNCLTCHRETKTESAPSMLDVQKRYKAAFADKKEFIKYMSEWVIDPNEEGSLMRDAIKKHGLMPQLGFDKDTLKDFTEYLYETDVKNRGGRYWSN